MMTRIPLTTIWIFDSLGVSLDATVFASGDALGGRLKNYPETMKAANTCPGDHQVHVRFADYCFPVPLLGFPMGSACLGGAPGVMSMNN